jgi:hypothetical protein
MPKEVAGRERWKTGDAGCNQACQPGLDDCKNEVAIATRNAEHQTPLAKQMQKTCRAQIVFRFPFLRRSANCIDDLFEQIAAHLVLGS